MRKADYYLLQCKVQNYDWGSTDPDSSLRQIASNSHQQLESNTPAAELWMGAHPSAPSILMPEKIPLDEAIRSDTYFAGEDSLSFLFKILHADKPLSIQAHPDLDLAKKLHSRDPKNYPDSNHKPELAVCLKGFRALVGFKKLGEIEQELRRLSPLARLCKLEEKNDLKTLYSNLMTASPDAIEGACVEILKSNLSDQSDEIHKSLVAIYGNRDAGVLAPYFLNYVTLSPGEGIFLGPNMPHSYLSGEILECMAASDNVVRAGLTKKFQDVQTLLSMLTYEEGPPTILTPNSESIYPVPVKDFLLRVIERETVPDRPGIVLVYRGSAIVRNQGGQEETLSNGQVIFVPKGGRVTILPDKNSQVYCCSSNK